LRHGNKCNTSLHHYANKQIARGAGRDQESGNGDEYTLFFLRQADNSCTSDASNDLIAIALTGRTRIKFYLWFCQLSAGRGDCQCVAASHLTVESVCPRILALMQSNLYCLDYQHGRRHLLWKTSPHNSHYLRLWQ
jgi:hypothetical protein